MENKALRLLSLIKECAEKQIYEDNVYNNCQIIINNNYEMQKIALQNKMKLDDQMDNLLRALADSSSQELIEGFK